MKNLSYGLLSCVASGLLTGCGTWQPSAPSAVAQSTIAAPADDGRVVPQRYTNHKTFSFTGTAQIFRVPSGVHMVRVIALGANGAGGSKGGHGGRVSADLPVSQLENLHVFVGGNASDSGGGFNGGGNGGDRYGSNGNGGGGPRIFERAAPA